MRPVSRARSGWVGGGPTRVAEGREPPVLTPRTVPGPRDPGACPGLACPVLDPLESSWPGAGRGGSRVPRPAGPQAGLSVVTMTAHQLTPPCGCGRPEVTQGHSTITPVPFPRPHPYTPLGPSRPRAPTPVPMPLCPYPCVPTPLCSRPCVTMPLCSYPCVPAPLCPRPCMPLCPRPCVPVSPTSYLCVPKWPCSRVPLGLFLCSRPCI